MGTLCVIDRQPRQLTAEQVEDLTTLGHQVTAQLRLRKCVHDMDDYRSRLEQMVEHRSTDAQAALRHIEVTYDDTLQALGAALDLRDNETAGHSRRVTRYCLEMARRMGYKDADLKSLERGSYLHDIGKIGIPDSVLLKPGALDAQERKVMESHVGIGYKLVNHISFLSDSAELVLCHQERFDGTGYPRGLKGPEIPLGARIFSVADTLDAMTSDRPYRSAMPFAEARAEIVHGSGTQFDPIVVAAFLATPEDTWEEIRREVASQLRLAITPEPQPARSSGAASDPHDQNVGRTLLSAAFDFDLCEPQSLATSSAVIQFPDTKSKSKSKAADKSVRHTSVAPLVHGKGHGVGSLARGAASAVDPARARSAGVSHAD